MKTASAALKAFIPSTRQFFEADLYTITPLGTSASSAAFVQDTDTYFANSSGVATQALAYGSNNVAGNTLFLLVGWEPSINITSITDSAGNAWTSLPAVTGGAGVHRCQAFYVLGCKGGANTVTAHFDSTGGTFIQMSLLEYSGIVSIGPHGEATISAAAFSSPSAVTIQPALILGYMDDSGGLSPVAGSGFTLRTGASARRSAVQDKINQPAGSYVSTFTTPSSGSGEAGIATFYSNTALRFTSCDRDITWNGNVYGSGGPLITRGGMKQSLGLTVDTLDLSIDVTPLNLYLGLPLLQQLSAGLLDGARFQLDRLFGTSFGDWIDSVTLFTGNIADIKELGRTRCNLQVRSRLELLNNSLPRMLFQPSCRWSLFDSGCNLLKPNFTANYTVAAGSTALTVKSTAAQADGYYDLGTILFLTGPNAGFSATVKTYLLSSGTFTFHAPLPFAPVNGDSFAASAGCDKSQAICTSRFANLINFGGQPFIPVPESAF